MLLLYKQPKDLLVLYCTQTTQTLRCNNDRFDEIFFFSCALFLSEELFGLLRVLMKPALVSVCLSIMIIMMIIMMIIIMMIMVIMIIIIIIIIIAMVVIIAIVIVVITQCF